MCNMTFQITTSQDTQDNVNKDAVIGVTSIGSAFAHLEQISVSLDIPCMSQRLYSKVHDKISDALEETSMQIMKDAAEEKRRLAIAEGDVDKNRTPLITIVVDDGCESYGQKCEKPDMTGSEYLEAKTKFLGEIKKNNEEILEIESLTREQADSDIWVLERRKRLIAAMFGSSPVPGTSKYTLFVEERRTPILFANTATIPTIVASSKPGQRKRKQNATILTATPLKDILDEKEKKKAESNKIGK
ncbi:unnamed protein product [Psylliodes chrysocephalus]|uniref:Mutator-like transposase domain-containing protein n=1 Tax=Psylliodes chrysocephalus TaxID=3402493 RepID=A0A9P0DC58_9CUCU|nr:unnamed protein product [Psylliodes chrysocephala]